MEEKNLVVVKLGGSVVTFKGRPLSPNIKAINNLAKALSSIESKLVIIHGGGSFGHFYAKKYNMSKEPSNTSIEGVAMTRDAMIDLNKIIFKALKASGLNCYTISPSALIESNNLTDSGLRMINNLFESGMPVLTYGDVISTNKGFHVLSGDSITRIISTILKPKRVVFTIDVDGVYDEYSLLRNLSSNTTQLESLNLKFMTKSTDVTGGMKYKILEASKISETGIDVCFVNGLKHEQVVKALIGDAFLGTLMRRD